MRKYLDILETFAHGFVPQYGRGQACEVFKNPDRREYKAAKADNDDVRAFLVGDDIYVWNTFQAVHRAVRDELKLPDTAVPLNLYGTPGSEGLANVSDATQGTPLWHNPEVYDMVQEHPYLLRAFTEIEITYYDEAIVGDWHRDDEDEPEEEEDEDEGY